MPVAPQPPRPHVPSAPRPATRRDKFLAQPVDVQLWTWSRQVGNLAVVLFLLGAVLSVLYPD